MGGEAASTAPSSLLPSASSTHSAVAGGGRRRMQNATIGVSSLPSSFLLLPPFVVYLIVSLSPHTFTLLHALMMNTFKTTTTKTTTSRRKVAYSTSTNSSSYNIAPWILLVAVAASSPAPIVVAFDVVSRACRFPTPMSSRIASPSFVVVPGGTTPSVIDAQRGPPRRREPASEF